VGNKSQWILVRGWKQFAFRLVLIVFFLFGWFFLNGTQGSVLVSNAASTCSTSGPTSGAYTVTLCFTSPTGSTVSGNVSVTAAANVTGTNPGIQRMVYSLNSAYLLTDYQSPYTFTLPTATFVDGNYTISASALMRDGFTTDQATDTVSFSNGVTTPPVNHNTFTPSLGTSPGSGNPLVVVAAGDGASGEANETSVTNLISSWNPNLFLYMGDVYEKGSPTEFYNWYGTNQTYSIFRSITDPTIGNHEYSASSTAAGYFNYWNNIPNYYSYTTGGWHFISLNADSHFGQYATSSAQYQWLVQDLAANTAACTIAYWHQPVYNIGGEPPQTAMQPIWALLAQNKVDIVLNGHDHDYQRWTPLDGSGNPSSTGVTEFVVGSGGHGLQTFSTTDPRMVVGFDSTTRPVPYGALRLQLFSTQAIYNYINTAGTVLDSGTITCQNAVTGPTATPTLTSTPTATIVPPTATNTPTITLTPTITFTPTITNTPLPPTNTPLPTATTSIFNFVPTADSYVSSSSPDTNFGTNTSLRADLNPTLLGYLKFNVQGLSGVPIRATLRIFFSSSTPIGVNIKGVSDTTWGEKTITYNNAPAVNSSTAGSSGPVTPAGTWVNIDITSLIPGNGLVSMAITTTSTTNISIASRESGANSPQLIIQN
jgi:hypothetical protein